MLTPGGIRLSVLNDGPDPVTIAQVTVDDAYWAFTAEENRTELGHLGRTRLDIPYPWVQGEAHFVKVITSTGTVFEHEIAVAVETPKVETRQILAFALIGLYVGVIPVALGLMWFPLVKRLGLDRSRRSAGADDRAAAVPADRHGARGCVLGVGAAGVVSGPGGVHCCGARRLSRARSVRLVAQGAPLGRCAAWIERRGAGPAHRHRHRPAQFRRGPRHRRGVRARGSRARHAARGRLHAPQHHRRPGDRRAPGEGAPVAAAARVARLYRRRADRRRRVGGWAGVFARCSRCCSSASARAPSRRCCCRLAARWPTPSPSAGVFLRRRSFRAWRPGFSSCS